ncbi:MAG: antibiotic biosynthesis monooxygenase family protein [Solirubrobacterales bacterium]
MFARVATYSGDPEELVRGFERARGELERMEGFSNAYFCVDRGSGKGLSMTLWETEAALEASAERAHQLRSQATQPSGATTDSVTHYEVALTAQGARSATA